MLREVTTNTRHLHRSVNIRSSKLLNKEADITQSHLPLYGFYYVFVYPRRN